MDNINKRIQKQYFRTDKGYTRYNPRAVNERCEKLIEGMAGDIIGDFVDGGSELHALLEDLDDPGSDAAGELLGAYWEGVKAAAKASAKNHGFH